MTADLSFFDAGRNDELFEPTGQLIYPDPSRLPPEERVARIREPSAPSTPALPPPLAAEGTLPPVRRRVPSGTFLGLRTGEDFRKLRRDESIIAARARIHGSFFRRSLFAIRRAYGALIEFIGEDLRNWLRWAFSPGRNLHQRRRTSEAAFDLARRIETLSTPKKLVIVSSPYVLALALAAVLLQNRSGAAVLPVDPAEVAAPAADIARPANEPAPAAPRPAPAAAVSPLKSADQAPAEQPAIVPLRAEPSRAEAKTQPANRVELPRKSALFSKPRVQATKAARLDRGEAVDLLPEVDAPEGWVVARSRSGLLGYLPALHLENKSTAALDKALKIRAKKKSKSRHGRSAR